MKQQHLYKEKTANHSNLGKELEDCLERTHHFYRVQKLAAIDKNPVEWRYINLSQYNEHKDKTPRTVAITANGEYLRKVRSDVDFAGTIKGGQSVYFDAKQTDGKAWPMVSSKIEHQVRTLLEKERMGAVSGLIILFTYEPPGKKLNPKAADIRRAFFVPASVVDTALFEMLYKRGRKSIPIADCERNGTEIRIESNALNELVFIQWLEAIKESK